MSADGAASSPGASPVRDRILLIGMMGVGKTTVGHALAARLGWPYLDNDELLARAVGKDTRRVQQEDGQAALRRAESLALTEALTVAAPVIAGVAGGVVTDATDRDRLRRGGFVVWLRADLDTLIARVRDTDRPWLGEAPEVAMRELYAGRAPLYAEVASLIVDVAGSTPQRSAETIASAFSREPARPQPAQPPPEPPPEPPPQPPREPPPQPRS
jgi:shikimate kinase